MQSARRWFAPGCVLSAFVISLGVGAAPTGAAPPEGFVKANGGQFAVQASGGAEPWQPVGYNQYRLSSMPGGRVCDPGYGAFDDQRLGGALDSMRAAGANTVRTWFFQSYWDPDGVGVGVGSWAAFDRVVAAAAARDMRVVPVLVNHWADCELGPAKTLDFYAAGYASAGQGYALSFRDYAATVASHFRDEPAIAFWQLVNEAEPVSAGGGCNETLAASELRAFAADVTSAVKAADPNHLVSLGTTGEGQCGTADGHYADVHEVVDVCEVHDYPQTGPNDAANVAIPGDQYNGIQRRLDQCGPAGLDKPIFVGELGIPAGVDSAGADSGQVSAASISRRATFMDSKIAAQGAAGMDGFLVWERTLEPSDSGYNSTSRGPYGVGPCDPVGGVLRRYSGVSGPQESCAILPGGDGAPGNGPPPGHGGPPAGHPAGGPSPGPGVELGGPGTYGDRFDFPKTTSFTLEAWVEVGDLADAPIFSKLKKGEGYALAVSDGALEFRRARRNARGKLRSDAVTGPALAPGVAHHVVARYDGVTMKLYVDGVCGGWQAVSALRLRDTKAAFQIGSAMGAQQPGAIEDAVVYDGLALHEMLIVKHFNDAGS